MESLAIIAMFIVIAIVGQLWDVDTFTGERAWEAYLEGKGPNPYYND